MGRVTRWLPGALAAAVLSGTAVVGCTGEGGRPSQPPDAVVGDAGIGAELIESYGCGSCHRVPGIDGADGLVGPPLDAMGDRTFIAGRLANNQQNMIRWVMDPLDVDSETAMPDLGVSEQDAEHISAYLAGLDG